MSCKRLPEIYYIIEPMCLCITMTQRLAENLLIFYPFANFLQCFTMNWQFILFSSFKSIGDISLHCLVRIGQGPVQNGRGSYSHPTTLWADNPLGQNYFQKHKYSVHFPISSMFPRDQLNAVLPFFPNHPKAYTNYVNLAVMIYIIFVELGTLMPLSYAFRFWRRIF